MSRAEFAKVFSMSLLRNVLSAIGQKARGPGRALTQPTQAAIFAVIGATRLGSAPRRSNLLIIMLPRPRCLLYILALIR